MRNLFGVLSNMYLQAKWKVYVIKGGDEDTLP